MESDDRLYQNVVPLRIIGVLLQRIDGEERWTTAEHIADQLHIDIRVVRCVLNEYYIRGNNENYRTKIH